MREHTQSLLLLCVCILPPSHSQAGLPDLPGIEAWQAAIHQHAQAEGRIVPRKEGEVSGLVGWEAQQRAVLEAERRLEQSGEVGTGGKSEKDITGKRSNIEVSKNLQQVKKTLGPVKVNEKGSSSPRISGVAGGFADIVKSSINKLLAKLSGKDAGNTSAGKQLKSKVETLLEKSREKKIKEQQREESFLDKLINTYSKEERDSALESVGDDRDILQLFKERYREKNYNNYRDRQKTLRQNRYRERFSFLYDYDYELPRQRKPSSINILNGDYLDSISYNDDYDYEDDFLGDLFDLDEERGVSSAVRESKLLDRQLKKLLRNI
jgi:F0F1-type ATP synthase epsilon subunit